MNVPASELMPVVREALLAGSTVRLTVSGSSMWPFVKSGDVVTLEAVGPVPPRVGDILLVAREADQYVLHRVVHRSGNAVFLAGDGDDRREGPLAPEQVLGRTVAVTRGSRTWSVVRGTWYGLGLLWVALLPVRSWLYLPARRLARLAGRLRSHRSGRLDCCP